jgi:preprotein translocase subunit SecA
VDAMITLFIPPQSLEEQWDINGLEQQLEKDFNLRLPIKTLLEQDGSLHEENLRQHIQSVFKDVYAKKEAQAGESVMRQFEKAVMLQTLDRFWREHLAAMDYLRQGIHLRGYAQKNPKQEYKREAFELFVEMLDRINYEVISILSKFEVRAEEDVERIEAQRREALKMKMEYAHSGAGALSEGGDGAEDAASAVEPFTRDEPKIGRNDSCPCGSGKKYKQCHGSLT